MWTCFGFWNILLTLTFTDLVREYEDELGEDVIASLDFWGSRRALRLSGR